eukprot:m.85813 g.85813  ORF g.85813 m.85813 type:complete len:501 (+) comp14739_c0_seq1:71-1573(+)
MDMLRRWTNGENGVTITVPPTVTTECTSILAQPYREQQHPYARFTGSVRSVHEAAQGRDRSRRVAFASQLTHYQTELDEGDEADVESFASEDGHEENGDPMRPRQAVQAFKDRNRIRKSVSYKSVLVNYRNSCSGHGQAILEPVVAQLQRAASGDVEAQRVLEVQGFNEDLEQLWCLLDAIQEWVDLRRITFKACGLNDTIVHALCVVLQRRRCLVYLDLSGNTELRYPSLASLQQLLKTATLLEHLDISSLTLKPRSADVLGRGVASSNLASLILDGCHLDQTAALAALLKPLARSRLTNLRLRGNRLDATCIKALSHLRIKRGAFCLDLGDNNFGRTDLRPLAHSIAAWRCQLDLRLANNKITNSHTAQGLVLLCHASPIVSLTLANNVLGCDSLASALKEGLSGNAHLRTLDLNGCQLADTAIIAIAESLSDNVGLQRLVLSDNPVTAAGLVALKATLRDNRSLRHLEVDRPPAHERVDLVDSLLHDIAEQCSSNNN